MSEDKSIPKLLEQSVELNVTEDEINNIGDEDIKTLYKSIVIEQQELSELCKSVDMLLTENGFDDIHDFLKKCDDFIENNKNE